MSKQGFNDKQVNPVLIKVGAESMVEGVTGNTFLPSEGMLRVMDMSGQIKKCQWVCCFGTALEKASPWVCQTRTSRQSGCLGLFLKELHSDQSGSCHG